MSQQRFFNEPGRARSFRNTHPILRTAEFGFALVMRAVPRRYRFDVALSLARFSVPVFRHTGAYREQRFHSPREIVLHLVLNALTKNGTRFDIPFTIDGYEHVERAYATGKGILLTGHHAALTVLLVRLLGDKGLDPVVITPDVEMRIPGTGLDLRTIQPSQMFLVQMRTKLRGGALVCAMPDRAEHHVQRTVEFATGAGRVIIAPAIIDVAARCGAQVLFTEVRLEGRHLAATIVSPTANASTAELVDEFVAFVRSRVGGCEQMLLRQNPELLKSSPTESFSGG